MHALIVSRKGVSGCLLLEEPSNLFCRVVGDGSVGACVGAEAAEITQTL